MTAFATPGIFDAVAKRPMQVPCRSNHDNERNGDRHGIDAGPKWSAEK
jgi:hypothetical protein